MKHYSGDAHINVGTGEDISIAELARMICDIVGVDPGVVHDRDKPDGTPRKLLDVARLRALGWRARIGLRSGLQDTYDWFVAQAGRSAERPTAIASAGIGA